MKSPNKEGSIMKRRILLAVTLFIVVLSAVACAGQGARSEQVMTEESAAVYAVPAEAPAADFAVNQSFDAVEAEATGQLPGSQERLIIRTADMSITAADTEATLAQIAAMADSSGGWVVSSNIYQSSDTYKTGYVTIRVPSEGFQSVLDAIAGLAVEVTNLSTSGQDVTEEYVDLNARLSNQEATAARLRQFLEESTNVEDALAVNVELSRVEGEIEALKGRIQFLEQSSAFSSITVNVSPDALAQPIQVGGWRPSGVAKDAIEALITMLQVLANAAIWFVLFALPILVVIAIPFVLLIWVIKRLRRRESRVAARETGDTDTGA